jgi:hypothetical protein
MVLRFQKIKCVFLTLYETIYSKLIKYLKLRAKTVKFREKTSSVLVGQ